MRCMPGIVVQILYLHNLLHCIAEKAPFKRSWESLFSANHCQADTHNPSVDWCHSGRPTRLYPSFVLIVLQKLLPLPAQDCRLEPPQKARLCSPFLFCSCSCTSSPSPLQNFSSPHRTPFPCLVRRSNTRTLSSYLILFHREASCSGAGSDISGRDLGGFDFVPFRI